MLRKLLCLCLSAVLLLSGCGVSAGKAVARPVEIAASPLSIPAPGALGTAPLDLRPAVIPMSASSLSIPAAFKITRPEKELTTTYASYFITGTSDPGRPVYFEDTEIQRLGTKGTFGVLVLLRLGENRFRFRQGDETADVVIVREAEGGSSPIREIVGRSMMPRLFSGAKAGGTLTVGCTAPSGATVTASFGGKSVALKPEKTGVKAGLPVSYLGAIKVGSDYEPGVTQKAGKVRYEMTYGGETTSYESLGEVYVAGTGGELVVEVVGYIGIVYPSLEQLGSIKETVKAGARDTLTRQNNDYAELGSGGFVPKDQLRILEGEASAGVRLSGAAFSKGDRSETVAFTGSGRPFYDTRIADNTFYLTLYNTYGAPGLNVSGSRLLAAPIIREGERTLTYAFPLTGTVWGYNVSFDEGDLLLTFKYKPASLSGMTILLDPGHGGTDPGALGVAGITGPDEADVNLAHAFVAKDYLEAEGANVILTRTDDSYLSLDDRLRLIEAHDAELFLSLQHNSVVESSDANKIAGLEVYYHTPLSAQAANAMMGGLAAGLNRNNRTVKEGVYRVTLMPHSPALLLELGFLSNPLEYEKSTDPAEMNKVAAAIVEGVRRSIA